MPLVIHPEWTESPGSSEDSPESWECGALEGVAGIAPHMKLGLWGSATGQGAGAGLAGLQCRLSGSLAEAAGVQGHTSPTCLTGSDPSS